MVHRLVNAYFDPPLLIVISGVPAWILVSPGHWFWYPPPIEAETIHICLLLMFCFLSFAFQAQVHILKEKTNATEAVSWAGLGWGNRPSMPITTQPGQGE